MAEGQGEGQVAVVEYRDEEEGEVPYLMLVKEALIEEKQWFSIAPDLTFLIRSLLACCFMFTFHSLYEKYAG